jgi:chromosome segregation ATPase
MMGTGKPPDGEELAALQEQLADARAEVERLQRDAANAEARAQHAVAESVGLRGELSASQEAIAATSADAATLREQIEEAAQRAQSAAERYRDLVVRTEPALPAELIAGDSIDAVDASVDAARAVVGRVRSHIESQAQAGRVPAGAPPRSGPDLSSMTPEQKIRYGLAQQG